VTATPPSRPYRAIAAYYDAEYAGGYVLDDDVPFLLRHMPRTAQRVLELCCGTGRAAIPLAAAGHRVLGIDVDDALLEIAARKKIKARLPDRRLRFQSANALEFTTDETFDWVTLLFNTFLNFTTVDEQDRLLRSVHACLAPGGTFWVDVFYPDLRVLAQPHWPQLDTATFFVPSLNRSVQRTTEIRSSVVRPQVQEMTFHYTHADDAGATVSERIAFDMTWMFPRELSLVLERNGFAVGRVFGDYDGSSVTPASPRIIMMAKKR
jgi:SAM-dependent methyltransferase